MARRIPMGLKKRYNKSINQDPLVLELAQKICGGFYSNSYGDRRYCIEHCRPAVSNEWNCCLDGIEDAAHLTNYDGFTEETIENICNGYINIKRDGDKYILTLNA